MVRPQLWTSRRSNRRAVAVLSVAGLVAMLPMSLMGPVHASGSDPAAMCGSAPSTPTSPGGGALTGSIVDATTTAPKKGVGTQSATNSAVVVASLASVEFLSVIGTPATAGVCGTPGAGNFSLDASQIAAGTEFVLGVGAPVGYASQWAPSGDRYLADVYRKTAQGGFQKRAHNSQAWSPVTSPVIIELDRGNDMTVALSLGGTAPVAQSVGITIWGVQPGQSALTFGGRYTNSSPANLIRVQGLKFNQHFKLEISPNGVSSSASPGFLKIGSPNWTVVKDPAEATTFFSPSTAGAIKIGGSSGSNVTGTPTVALATGRTVSGTLVADGTPVSGACVGLAEKSSVLSNGRWIFAGQTCTGSNGTWVIAGVSEGDYLLRIWGQGTGVIDSFYKQGVVAVGDPNQATTITVSASNVSNIVAQGQKGFTVTGSVARASGNSEICISAFRNNAMSGQREWAGGTCTKTTTFSLSVPAGTYRLEYSDRSGSLMKQWSGGKSSYEEATDVVVSANRTVSPVTLSSGASISGDISLAGIVPDNFRGICVSALEVTGNTNDWGRWVAGTCDVASDGTFTLGGLKPASSVKLRFESFISTHRSVFYKSGSPSWTSNHADATLISTGTTGLTIELPQGVAIQGEITTTAAALAAGVCLSAMASDWKWVAGTCSPDGRFSLNGLPSDANLRVWVQPPPGSSDQRGGWLTESSGSWAISPTFATVSATVSRTGVVASLTSGVRLLGQVTPTDIKTCVMAFDATTFAWLGRGCTDTNGKYSINGLPPTTQLQLYVTPQSDDYVRDWLRSGGNPEQVGSSSGTKDITLVASSGGSISGKVSMNSTGVAQAIVVVKTAGAPATTSAISITATKADGTYTIKGLSDGNYDLFVVDGSGRFQTPSPITNINISSGAAVTGKDFSVVAVVG